MLGLRSAVLAIYLLIHLTPAQGKRDDGLHVKAATMFRVPYKNIGNLNIPTDVYIPTAPPANRTLAPVLLMVHGGGFILGSSGLNNKDQIQDSVERGWIVLGLEHRLCPGVNLLEGPMTDVRDALTWAQSGGLASALQKANSTIRPDVDRVVAMGTSAGGHLVLSLAFGVPKPPLAILDFYGAQNFRDPFWSQPLPELVGRVPAISQSDIDKLHKDNTTYATGTSFEGQTSTSTSASDNLRQSYSLVLLATGRLIPEIWPSAPKGLELIDPYLNVNKSWPPVSIVHGTNDTTIPMFLSKALETQLKASGVENEFIEVPGEAHTFAGRMVKGSKTWYTQRKGFDFLEKVIKRSYN